MNLFHPFFEISRISSAGSRNSAMNWHGKLLCTKYNSVRFIAERTCRFGYPVRKWKKYLVPIFLKIHRITLKHYRVMWKQAYNLNDCETLYASFRDRSIYIEGLGPVHFKFSIEKKCMSYLTKTQKVIVLHQKWYKNVGVL